MTALQSDALASGEKMLAEGFIALERSVHHVTMLMETVSELNLSGQMHAMTWGNEMLADGFHTLRKITQCVKGIQKIVHTLKIQESDMIAHGEEMLVDEFKALQKDYLHVKELEEIVHQMNIQEQYAIHQEALEDFCVKVDSASSVNKKRTFSTQQDAKERIEEEKQVRIRELAKIRSKKKYAEVKRFLNNLSDDAKLEHAKMKKELANEEKQECAKACPKEKRKMRNKKKNEELNRILKRLPDDEMMATVLQSLGHPSTISVDLLSNYTLWLFTATKYHKNGRLMNRWVLMKAFVVEYFSIARR